MNDFCIAIGIVLVAALSLPLGAVEKPAVETARVPDYAMSERKDIPSQDTWKLEDLYPAMDDWKADRDQLQRLIARVDEVSKEWTSAPGKMLSLLELLSTIDMKTNRLFAYASLLCDGQMSNPSYQGMRGEMLTIATQFGAKISFVNPDILALGAQRFAEYLKAEPALKPYRFTVEQLLRSKDHVLASDQERIVSLTGLFAGATGRAARMLNDVEAPPARVTLGDGTSVELNIATFLRHRRSPVASDRNLVMHAYFDNLQRYQNTLAILLDGAVKQHLFDAQVHNYRDCREASLFGNDIDPKVYDQLLSSVRANLAPLHRYLSLKRELLGLERYRYEDIYASAVPSISRTYTYSEAREIVMNSMKPLGPEYAKALEEAFDGRWIDVYPNKDKQSGAFSSGIYGVHPYVKLNYDGQYDWVSTLAHELGHALHSLFSNRTQPYPDAQYPIFLAEVASTFNENLLMQELLKSEKDDAFKLYVLDSYLERVRGTVYRQALFAELELAMHRRVEEGQTLTPDWLNAKYLGLTRDYYGHDQGVCDVGDFIQTEWSSVPHFYRQYYVYQYATGLIASVALSDTVLKGGPAERDRYLDLLKAGGSDFPVALLKKAGVDMTAPAPADAAFRRFGELVDEMETIVARMKAGRR